MIETTYGERDYLEPEFNDLAWDDEQVDADEEYDRYTYEEQFEQWAYDEEAYESYLGDGDVE